MPVDLSYKGMFVDIFLQGGIVFAYLALVAYRIMAASLFPRINDKIFYWLFCMLTFVGGALTLPLTLRGGVTFGDFACGVLVLIILSVPCIILGTVGILLRWRWRAVLLSCILEVLLFPIWFFLLFTVCLYIFDCGD